jgi:hypothetical protein
LLSLTSTTTLVLARFCSFQISTFLDGDRITVKLNQMAEVKLYFVSEVEKTQENMVFQRAVTELSEDKEITLGPDDRKPIDTTLPDSPLYVTLLNASPGVNAALTITLLSDPGPFGLGGG